MEKIGEYELPNIKLEIKANRAQLMRTFKIYRPIICAAIFVAFSILSLIVFGQPASAHILFAGEAATGYEAFTATLGLITQMVIAVAAVTTLIWFVWKGKSNEQLREMVAGWKDTAERLKIRVAELEASDIASKAEVARLKKARVDDRKKILRLTARVAGEDYDELEITDEPG